MTGEDVAMTSSWEVGPDAPRWVTFLGLDRLLVWLFNKTEEPSGEGRCPWLSPLSDQQCIGKRGHRGVCTIRIDEPPKAPIRYRQYYGVNYE